MKSPPMGNRILSAFAPLVVLAALAAACYYWHYWPIMIDLNICSVEITRGGPFTSDMGVVLYYRVLRRGLPPSNFQYLGVLTDMHPTARFRAHKSDRAAGIYEIADPDTIVILVDPKNPGEWPGQSLRRTFGLKSDDTMTHADQLLDMLKEDTHMGNLRLGQIPGN